MRTLARQHFHVVDRGTNRDVADRQVVTGLDRRFRAVHQRLASHHALRGDDVPALAVGEQHERDVGATVRIVFQALDLGGNTVLVVALEVDHAIVVLMTTALVAGGDMTIVVTARLLELLFQQRSVRGALVQVVVHDLHHRATARGSRLGLDECHDYLASASKLIS
ncbi:hypothetical protein D3C85_1300580 [compost metagenome]